MIDAGDPDGEPLYNRSYLEPGPGLGATLHAGQAIGAATWRYGAYSTPLVFAPDVTSYVWLLATHKPAVMTAAAQPESGAVLL